MSCKPQSVLSELPLRRMLPTTFSLLATAILQASLPSIAMAEGLRTAGVVTQGQASINASGGTININ